MPRSRPNSTLSHLSGRVGPSELILLKTYSKAVFSTRPLTETRKLKLLSRLPSLDARRRLVGHFLPWVFQWAAEHPGSDLLRKIEAGNRALTAFFRDGNCRPWDDVDYMVRERVLQSFKTVP